MLNHNDSIHLKGYHYSQTAAAHRVATCITTNHDGFRNRVTLNFYPLTSGSMHAEQLLRSIRVPSLVLIAQAVSALECI